MAWYLRWQCKFASLNETQYSVNIYEKTYSGSTTQLEAATNPFVTYENNSEDIFTPIREQTGYLRVLDTDGTLMEKIVPKNNTEKKVTLTDGSGNVKWQGFLCASAYTQPWDSQTNVIEFPVKSVLAALEDVQLSESEASSGDIYIAQLFINAFQNLGIDITSIYESSDMQNGQIYLWNIYLQCKAFFTEEIVNDAMAYTKIYVGASYYECIASVMQLYGLTIREEGDCLHVAHYDKTNSGRIVSVVYSWTLFKIMATGDYTMPDFNNMPDNDMLTALEFTENNNVAGFLNGARSAKITIEINSNPLFELSIPECVEDDSEVTQVGNVSNGSVFVQPHSPRSGTNETFSFYRVVLKGDATALESSTASTYANCLANCVIKRPTYDPQNDPQRDPLYTGAFPCRWVYKDSDQSSSDMVSGLFLNQEYFSSKLTNFTPNYCYQIKSSTSVTLTDGFLNIDMQCYNFMGSVIIGSTEQLRFGEFNTIWATKPQTTLYCILTFGNRMWNGSSWKEISGNYETFTLKFDGANVISNKTSSMNIDLNTGLFIPVSGTMTGVITFYITNLVGCSTDLGFHKAQSRIISNLEILFVKEYQLGVSSRTQNTYRKTIIQSGFADDKSISIPIGTINNNKESVSFLKTSPTSYLQEIGYDLDRDIYTRPELRLLNRMANYYSMARRTFMGVVQIGVELMKTRYSYIGKKFFGVKDETNWADDTQTVKFIEVT